MAVVQLQVVIASPIPAELSPNWRGHWTEKAAATKAYRRAACMSAVDARNRRYATQGVLWVPPRHAVVEITVRYPTSRLRDLDNIIAALKPVWDGLVDAGVLHDDTLDTLGVSVVGVEKGEGVLMTISG